MTMRLSRGIHCSRRVPRDTTTTDYHFYVNNEGFSHGGAPITGARVRFGDASPPGVSHFYVDDLEFSAAGGIANGGFETGDVSGWQISGDAFEVTQDTDWGWGGPFNHEGRSHVWGFKRTGDAGTGELRSSAWTICGNPYVDFLIGGGAEGDLVYVALVVDGVEVRRASGWNTERYRRVVWDVRAYDGRPAYIKVVDHATGSWGHLNIDDVHVNNDSLASDTYVGLPNHDFESGTLDGWVASGDAFSDGDVTRDRTWWGGPFDHSGEYHLWGYKAGHDDQIGTLHSRPFVLGGTGQIDFLIAGGHSWDRLYVRLVRVIDGEVLFSATGENSERYRRVEWMAQDHLGEQVQIVVGDQATGSWGHINVDDVNVQAVP